jgi:rare lipoprotein A
MPKPLQFNGTLIKQLTTAAISRWQLLALCAVVVLAGFGIVQYQRAAAERAQDEEEERWASGPQAEQSSGPSYSPRPGDAASAAQKRHARALLKPREVNAAWYDVPDDSLAKRRAGERELTAAHNRLPIGTLVRVTHLKNGKSVVVRITDRGIRDQRVKIDLCKQAAEELEMVRKGIARVRMEVMPEEYAGGAAGGDSYTAAPHP